MVDQKQCLFCRIVKGEIPAKKVYEDPAAIGFLDINPRNPGHTLVIPKRHAETIFDFPEGDGGAYFAAVKKVAALVKNGTKAHGVSLCQNNGSAAGQVVGHMHFHVIPRFLNEGPPALEAILPVKKMDEQSLDKIAAAIKGGSALRRAEPGPVEEPRQEPEEGPELAAEPSPAPRTRKKKASPEDEEDDADEFEEFEFRI